MSRVTISCCIEKLLARARIFPLSKALYAKEQSVVSKLIVIGGLPCCGKTTLAKELSSLLSLPVISKDELEAAIARKGLVSNKKMNGVGYELMATIAKNHIDSDSSVIFDFVASKNRVLECWPSLYNSEIKYIECVCNNEELHKKRIQSRNRNIVGWYELTWEEVLEIKSVYEPLFPERHIVDSANALTENIELARKYKKINNISCCIGKTTRSRSHFSAELWRYISVLIVMSSNSKNINTLIIILINKSIFLRYTF